MKVAKPNQQSEIFIKAVSLWGESKHFAATTNSRRPKKKKKKGVGLSQSAIMREKFSQCFFDPSHYSVPSAALRKLKSLQINLLLRDKKNSSQVADNCKTMFIIKKNTILFGALLLTLIPEVARTISSRSSVFFVVGFFFFCKLLTDTSIRSGTGFKRSFTA